MQNYLDNGGVLPQTGRPSQDSDNEESGKPYQDSALHLSETFECPFKPSSTLRFLLKSIAVILALGVIFSFSTIASPNFTLTCPSLSKMTISPNPSQNPCGADPKSAREALCYFDAVTVAWLPSECHDYELTAEFLKEKERHFYARPGALLSLANVMQGQHATVFVNGEYLRDRCVFAWRKLHRAVLAGTKIDGYSLDWGSLLQCEDYLLRRDESYMAGLHAVNVSYPSCSSI